MTGSIRGGVLAAVILTGIVPAAAQEEGSAAAGRELATKLCSTCHIVGAEPVGSDVAPPFPVLAKDPGMTLTELHGWQGPMHPVLSSLALTSRQIADVNAYLDSLRPPASEPQPAGGRPAETEEPPPALQTAPPEKLGAPIEVKPE